MFFRVGIINIGKQARMLTRSTFVAGEKHLTVAVYCHRNLLLFHVTTPYYCRNVMQRPICCWRKVLMEAS